MTPTTLSTHSTVTFSVKNVHIGAHVFASHPARATASSLTRRDAWAASRDDAMPPHARARAVPTEPTKRTVGAVIRALELRVVELENERSRDVKREAAMETLARATDGLSIALREALETMKDDRATALREREDLREVVRAASRAASDAARGAAEREREAARAREVALAVDRRVSECVAYVRDVRDEVVGLERAAREAKAAQGELWERDERRERALDALESRARAADATLRDELESVRRETSRVEAAVNRLHEIENVAKDLRELAQWSKKTATYQNGRLAALERVNEREDKGASAMSNQSHRLKELVTMVQNTAETLKAHQARLNAMDERGHLVSRRDAATRADVDVVKRALVEHHDILVKVCETFDAELNVRAEAVAPASAAFARLHRRS